MAHNMKNVYLTFIAVLAFVVPVQAEIVIDDFGVSQTVNNSPFGGSNSGNPMLNDGVPGVRNVSVNGAPPVTQFLTNATVGQVTFQSDNPGSVITMDYQFSLPLSLTGGLTNLAINMFENVTGLWLSLIHI